MSIFQTNRTNRLQSAVTGVLTLAAGVIAAPHSGTAQELKSGSPLSSIPLKTVQTLEHISKHLGSTVQIDNVKVIRDPLDRRSTLTDQGYAQRQGQRIERYVVEQGNVTIPAFRVITNSAQTILFNSDSGVTNTGKLTAVVTTNSVYSSALNLQILQFTPPEKMK